MLFKGRMAGYSFEGLRKDIIAGLIVGIIAIPLGMAFAIAVGVKPEYGIYTAIFAGIMISIFGGSKYQIGGPTGAFIPILFTIVANFGYEKLLVVGIIAGVILVLMGIFKLGSLIKFVPRPVTIGFTSGVALIIFVGQLANFLGLEGVQRHEAFVDNILELWNHLNTVNLYSLITALICFIAIMITPKYFPKIPGSLIGLVSSTLVATLLFPNQVETIGTAFGNIPNTLPALKIPSFQWTDLPDLIRAAFVIAILGAIESLLSCVVADGMTGERHNSNKELIGQGLANIVIPFFGGIPATGAIARTATNIRSGAVSPVSGVVHSIVVLLTLLLLAPYASLIPLASMAPVLMVVAWNMSELRHFTHVLRTTKSDAMVLITTFLLTVFVNLTVAVEFGLLLAGMLFVKRMSELLKIDKVLPDHDNHKVSPHVVAAGRNCQQIIIYTIEGPLFFGVAQMFEKRVMDTIKYKPKVLILRLGNVPMMDATGEANLANLIENFIKNDRIVLLTEVQEQPISVLKNTGLYDLVGAERIFDHTGDAITYALTKVDHGLCKKCKVHAFNECKTGHLHNLQTGVTQP